MLEKQLFDGDAMVRELDAQRAARGLDWNGLAYQLYEQSSDLNAQLNDNCMCQGALVRTAKRGTMTCQYALIILRWIERRPEDFLRRPAVDVGETGLPVVGPTPACAGIYPGCMLRSTRTAGSRVSPGPRSPPRSTAPPTD